VHLAAIPVEAPFEEILQANFRGTWAMFEAARLEGCERVVFASSNHASGYLPVADRVGDAAPIRPDTYYGVSKVFGEAIGSLYHDKFRLRVACIRIGTAIPRPLEERHLSTWLSPGDLIRLASACLVSPDLGFAIVYGVSANRRRWWDLEAGRRLGYEPVDDAESYAAEVERNPIGLVRVAHRLLDLADHARVHVREPSRRRLRRPLRWAPVSQSLWRAALSASPTV